MAVIIRYSRYIVVRYNAYWSVIKIEKKAFSCWISLKEIMIYWHFPLSRENEMAMMTSSNGNIFRVTSPLCGEFTGPGEFALQRPATRSFDVFFDLRLNKRLSEQPWGWWFETLLWSLWRQCNAKNSQEPVYSVWSKDFLMMTWQRCGRGINRQCIWLFLPGVLRSQHVGVYLRNYCPCITPHLYSTIQIFLLN